MVSEKVLVESHMGSPGRPVESRQRFQRYSREEAWTASPALLLNKALVSCMRGNRVFPVEAKYHKNGNSYQQDLQEQHISMSFFTR
jgi:hypothetical protein